MAALQLALDAIRPIRHSRTLATNINRGNPGQARPDNTDAHHIVGRTDYRARESRVIIYSKGIAMNDTDNGCYLPRYKSSVVPTMPGAHDHQGLHTDRYYLAVHLRLLAVESYTATEVRQALRNIKKELIAGTFPK